MRAEMTVKMGKIMFRLWAKIFKVNRMLQDLTICDDSKDKNRTKKVFDALDEVCYAFDLSRPIWLNTNIDEFKRNDKTRFRRDNFIDDIVLFLEIHVTRRMTISKQRGEKFFLNKRPAPVQYRAGRLFDFTFYFGHGKMSVDEQHRQSQLQAPKGRR